MGNIHSESFSSTTTTTPTTPSSSSSSHSHHHHPQTNNKNNNHSNAQNQKNRLSGNNNSLHDHIQYEIPILQPVVQPPERICSCRIVLFQDSSLKGNVLLYDSLKDPLIRRAYANMRAKSNNQQQQQQANNNNNNNNSNSNSNNGTNTSDYSMNENQHEDKSSSVDMSLHHAASAPLLHPQHPSRSLSSSTTAHHHNHMMNNSVSLGNHMNSVKSMSGPSQAKNVKLPIPPSISAAHVLKRSMSAPMSAKVGVNDTTLLGEMIFGAIPMQIKGQNTKVHFLPAYKQTLLTKLFQVGIPASTLASVDPLFESKSKKKKRSSKQQTTTTNSSSSTSAQQQPRRRHSQSMSDGGVVDLEERTSGAPCLVPVDEDYFSKNVDLSRPRSYSTSSIQSHTPLPFSKRVSNSDNEDGESPGINSSSSGGGGRPQTMNDMLLGHSDGMKDDDSQSSSHSGHIGRRPVARRRKKKAYSELNQYMCKSVFALGVVFVFHESSTVSQGCDPMKARAEFAQQSSHLQKLIFSHFAIIEHRMRKLLKVCSASIRNRLREAVLQAQEEGTLSQLFHGYTFNMKLVEHVLQTDADICKSAKEFQKFILSFIHSPRLEKPLWFRHNAFMIDRVSIFSEFLGHLFYLIDNSPPKMEKFLSVVFSAVLTHHLSWTTDFTEENNSDLLFTDPGVILAEQLCSLFGAGYWSYDSNKSGSGNQSNKSTNDSLFESMVHKHKSYCSGTKKFCKVVVVGSNETLVRHLLYLLSYILRSRKIVECDYTLQADQQVSQQSRSMDDTSSTDDVSNLGQSYMSGSFLASSYDMRNNTSSFYNEEQPVEQSFLKPLKFVEIGPTLKTDDCSVMSAPDAFRKRLEQQSVDANYLEEMGLDPDGCMNVARRLDFSSDEDSEEEENMFHIIPGNDFVHVDQERTLNKLGNKSRMNKFGHALYGDISPVYCGALVLTGLPKNVDFIEEAISDLKLMQNETMDGDDEPPDVATCVIADLDDMICNVIVSNNNKKHYQHNDMKQFLPKNSSIKFEEAIPSDFISQTLINLREFKMMGLPDSACESYFNNQLKQLYMKSISTLRLVEGLVHRSDPKADQQANHHHHHSTSNHGVSAHESTPQHIKDLLSPISARSTNSDSHVPSYANLKKLISAKDLSTILHVTTRDVPLILSVASSHRADIPFYVNKRVWNPRSDHGTDMNL